MFCLFYENKTRKVHGLNGSGRAPMSLTLDIARRKLNISPGESGNIPLNSVLAVTTPGAAAGWVDTLKCFGSGNLSLAEVLEPATALAEDGFPVSEISARLVRQFFLRINMALVKLTVYSGRKTHSRCERRHQISANFSRPTPERRKEFALPCLEKL
jgi:gamma-glutamyltranspeptidase/glutathione hydrolase